MFAVILAAVITAIVGLSFIGKKEEKNYEELRSEAVETTKETDADKKETEDIKETSRHETKETEENETPVYEASMTIDHEKMKKVNSDYVCWINIPGTDISYPVVLPEDNDFYLHRTFEEKDYAYAGTLFIDAFSEKGLDQDNLIIYGHNMKNGTMFADVDQFSEKEFWNEHQDVDVYLEDREIRMTVVASVVGACDAKLRSIDTIEKLKDFCKDKTITNGTIPGEWEQMYVLVTCNYTGDNYRTYLFCKRK